MQYVGIPCVGIPWVNPRKFKMAGTLHCYPHSSSILPLSNSLHSLPNSCPLCYGGAPWNIPHNDKLFPSRSLLLAVQHFMQFLYQQPDLREFLREKNAVAAACLSIRSSDTSINIAMNTMA